MVSETYEHYRDRVDYMLRRCPQVFSLRFDGEGWTPLRALLSCLKRTERSFLAFFEEHQARGDRVCEIKALDRGYAVRAVIRKVGTRESA